MACKGDSGGSFALKNKGKWYLRGVVSFGISKFIKKVGTCHDNYSSLFVDVTGYMDWIVKTVTEYQK
jgi:secreted trypsin-like serine protease